MAYKIKATYKPTGKKVFASSRKFQDLDEAKDYAKEVVGTKRFKGIRYEKVN